MNEKKKNKKPADMSHADPDNCTASGSAAIIPAMLKKSPSAPVAPTHIASAGTPPLPGFAYSRAFFEELVDSALAHARKLGASDAGAEASEGAGLSVSVRKGALENVERNRDKSLGVTVYLGHRRGNASTSDFSPQAIERTVQAAYDTTDPVDFRIVFDEAVGDEVVDGYYEGPGVITDFSITGNNGEYIQIAITIQGAGKLNFVSNS